MPPGDKHIGLDLRMWNHAGIGRYMRELFSAMFALDGPVRFRCLGYLKDEPSIRRVLKGSEFVEARSDIYSFGEQAELTRFSGTVALLHVPHFNAPLFCRSKLVVTIHDLIYLKEKRFSGNLFAGIYVRALIAGIQQKAKAVLTVSEFTRRDLEKSFPRLNGRIRVVHEAASLAFRAGGESDTSKKFGLDGDYVLFVGSLKAHKNLPVLLEAFELLRKQGRTSARLAVVGRKDPKEKALLEKLERSGDFVSYLGELADEDLAGLYRNARALVIPSFWEGFGLTAVEAMACGTPVISSDRASLPEVIGEAGLYFDPTRADTLAGHLSKVLSDPALRESLSQKGLKRSRQFSWENAARQTLDVYREALAG